jgi:hypothetical protein
MAEMDEMDDSEWTVERHLAGASDDAIALYRRFIELAEACGPFTYAVSKSAITLKGTRRGFAGIRTRARGVRGYLDLQREIADRRITRSEPYTKRLFVHHFALASIEEMDDEFAGWLGEAYAVGAGEHLGPDVGAADESARPPQSVRAC